jgi:N-acetylglucosaminyl-diphospho-decaprenol L-rhamnosyltransferase
MISVILVQYNNGRLTVDAIRSLRKHHPGEVEIIVVDNASTDDSLAIVRDAVDGVTVLENKVNAGFGAANNRAASLARGDLLCFLNNDTVTRSPFLTAAEARFAQAPDVGIHAPRLVYADETFQLSAGRLPGLWREMYEKLLYALERRRFSPLITVLHGYYSRRRHVGWVTGAALVMRKSLFEAIGRFDEEMFMYFEDKDLCRRTWDAGYAVEFDPQCTIVHFKGGSSPEDASPFLRSAYRASQRRYYAKHRPRYEQVVLSWYQNFHG